VAGRSGRGKEPGKVILQAFDPDHPVLRQAVLQDYEAFFAREVEYRRTLRYPPFTAVVRIVVQDRDPGRSSAWAWRIAEAVRREAGGRLLVIGPGPAPVERLKDRFRHQILVRSAGRRKLVSGVDRALSAVEGEVPGKAILVDVDPYSVL
jgi:primosomal protein N' (replication factor Y)